MVLRIARLRRLYGMTESQASTYARKVWGDE
jgi:hypothetical protein